MNQTLVNNINKKVKSDDILYILGDFCFGNIDKVKYWRDQLDCKTIHFIQGNHDSCQDTQYRQVFQSVNKILTINVDGQKVIMCHYPLLCWDSRFYGSWHLFGHCHGNMNNFINEHLYDQKMIDVGIDCGNYFPYSFDDLKKYFVF